MSARTFFTSTERRRAAVFVTSAFVVSRAAIFFLIFCARQFIPEQPGNRHKDYVAFPTSTLWDSFARWDSGWYGRIADKGYFPTGGQSDVAFFPAYPYGARYLGKLLGVSYWAGGLVLSNVALLGALFFMYWLARKYLDEDGARRTLWMMLAFPTAIFFSCFYTESLYVLAVAAALYYYEDDRYLPAALCAMFAAFTRSTGILLLPALAGGAIWRRGLRLEGQTPRTLWFALIPLGLLAFMWMLKSQVGDPLAFLKAQEFWHRTSGTSPLATLYEETRDINLAENHKVLDLINTVLLLALVAYSLRRLDSSLTILLFLSILMPITSGKVHSMERYALMPPVFLALGLATKRPAVERAVLVVMAMFLGLHTVLFAGWYWAG